MTNMMAMEGRLRKPHRRNWPGFLNHVVPPSVWQSLHQRVSPQSASDARWTLKYILLVYIGMGWAKVGTLRDRFGEAREWVVGLFRRRQRPGQTYVGLTEAAQKYGVALFQQFWACLRRTVPPRLGAAWYWHNWIVFAVDGSRNQASRTRANEKALGQAGRDKSHPQWWMTWLVHMPTGLLWDWRQGPGTSSERGHMEAMLPSLPPGALLVGDIGFGGFDFLWKLARTGTHFLIRCGSNTTLLVDDAVSKVHKSNDYRYVYLWPTGRRGQKPLKLRLIVLKRRHQRVYLLTNVLAPTRLPRRVAHEFYAARWGIEVRYRDFKQTMKRAKILARTPRRGALELAGNIVALGLLRVQAAIALGARVCRVSAAEVLRILRRGMDAIRFRASTHWFFQQLTAASIDDYERHRSKSARDWPHKKNEDPPGPPKLRRPTKHQRAQLYAKITSMEGQFA